MRTKTKPTDLTLMLKFATTFVGRACLDVIAGFARKRRIVDHRAASVFWNLVDDGRIICHLNQDGVEVVDKVGD
ncbi:MAG: hypothetical protein LBP55_03565 [Candidatus Adiutrix sp.]|jgi:hypothetical protein|nr:hypothetical protein [Candidatus Adiutrix sp.]